MCTLTIWSSVLCVLMVEGMSVVVNVMLSLMSVMSPPPALGNLSLRTVVKLCTLGVLTLGESLVSWIVMISACVSWTFNLSSSSLFFSPFMLTCSITFSAGSVCLCGIYSAVVVLGLSVRLTWYPMLWVRLLRWLWCMYCCLCCMWVCCEGVGNAGVGSGGSLVAVSAHMGGKRGSGVWLVQVTCYRWVWWKV